MRPSPISIWWGDLDLMKNTRMEGAGLGMCKLFAGCLLVLFSHVGLTGAQARELPPGITLYVGSVTVLEPGPVSGMVVGNDALVAATVLDDHRLVLLPEAPGTTELVLLDQDGGQRSIWLRVLAAEVADDFELLRDILSEPYPGVAIRQTNGVTVLSGTVRAEDFDGFRELVQGFRNVISTVRPRLALPIEDTIAMDVQILEVNKQYRRNLGIRWDETAAGPAFGVVANIMPNDRFGVVSNVGDRGDLLDLLGTVGPGSSSPQAYLGLTSIIGSQLEMLQENGVARTLAEPTLSTLSGQSARFLVGGDFPVAVLNQFGQPVVEFREFGIRLEIEPFLDDELNIRSRVRTEVSSIDFSTQIQGVPGVLRRESVSTINARPGDTIVISGLVNAADGRNVAKVPLLGDLPILGQLFRSRSFQEQRTELLVLVTPRIQRPNTPVNPDLRENRAQLRQLLGGSSRVDSRLLE
jgi:pilus assembly protein CpaC